MSGVVLRRLLRADARRIITLGLALVAWFALILLVVRNGGSAVTAKTQLAGNAMARGFGIGGLDSPDALLAQMLGVSFNHPIVLAIVGAVSGSPGIRSCRGELDAGTLELTLARPIARWRYLTAYAVHAVIGVTMLMVVSWLVIVGMVPLFGVPGSIDTGDAALACLDAGIVFFSFAGIGLLGSVLFAHRGNATAVVWGVVGGMFALTFAQRAWDATWLAWLERVSVFHRFDPGGVFAGGGVSIGDVLTPLIVGVVTAIGAVIVFERRDL